MNRTSVVPPRRARQRGQALAFIGVSMIVFTGMMVVGVDVARLAFTAAEVQSIADAAATAGALAMANGAANPQAEAETVIQANYVDRYSGSLGSGAADVVKSLTPGAWDFATGAFTAGGWTDPTTNAVRARAVARVDNLVAAAVGMLQSDVERQATAAVGGSCTQPRLVLPVALEESLVQQYLDSADCSSLPPTNLFQVPDENSCFTSLSSASANANDTISMIPSQCCKQGNVCGGGTGREVSVGQDVNVVTGQLTGVLQVIQGCLADPDGAGPLEPLREFVVPLVEEGHCNQSTTVTGFARIVIDSVVDTGSDKGIRVTAMCRDTLGGGNPGCQFAGGGLSMAIVK